jgi:hypothetical protein
LNLLTAPPISSSMSTIAKIEAARRMGTLDLEFAGRLFQVWKESPESSARDDGLAENNLLRWAIAPCKLSDNDGRQKVKPVITLAMILAIVDEEPMAVMNWMKANRLSFFSIPGFKGRIYENLILLQEKGKAVGFSDADIKVVEMLAKKLKPLAGM